MASFVEALEQLRRNRPKSTRYGIDFEKLIVNFFKQDPVLSNQYTDVCRWTDWAFNDNQPDTGIDLVARRREDANWVAIQCKFYKSSSTISKSHLDSFFESSGRSFITDRGRETFAQRIIISTTDNWSSNAEKMLDNQLIPTNRIGLADMQASPINWELTFPAVSLEIHLTRRETFEPREHQATAIAKALEGFGTHDRGKLIMACGTGKTFTSLRLAEKFTEDKGGKARILFLVPSIALLSQTLKEWTAQAREEIHPYAVCSDQKVTKKAEDIAPHDLQVGVSTNGAAIAERFAHSRRAKGMHVIFSTYQSLPAVHDAQQQGLEDFDLVICDEAHRTTGITLAGEAESNFVRIHDSDYIRASKRLYMTATPRLFDDAVKGKAADHSAEVASMDDEGIFGPEFHHLGFGEAVAKNLLTDYRVLVMTVDEEAGASALAASPGQNVNLNLAASMIGAWNGLAKRSGGAQGTKLGFEVGAKPMQRAVAFAKDIRESKQIAESYPALVGAFQQSLRDQWEEGVDATDSPGSVSREFALHNVDLDIAARHVDGGMNAMERNSRLSWLESDVPEDQTRLLTNARCLSEGVDVPALDSIIFFNPRNSMVDVVQSVGRVMRKAKGKDYGYIILPVAVPPGVSPAAALNDNKRFKVVWQILNALRAHDERFNAKVNSIGLNSGADYPAKTGGSARTGGPATSSGDPLDDLGIDVEHVDDPKKAKEREAQQQRDKLARHDGDYSPEPEADDGHLTSETLALFSLEQWQEAMYTKLVDKVGTRTYWEDWADDVADIAEAQITRIHALLDMADSKVQKEFDAFVEGLRGNLNDSISRDEAISMLSQHLITAPVFNALFQDSDFAAHNPVSQVMQRMVDALSDAKLESETDQLEKFYESVRVRAAEVTSATGKQQVIKDLYERFFRKAFRKQSEALGIVYTPIEIVDFILRASDDLSREHFGRGLTDEGVHILDPFTGTGTFMVRLLQSGIIRPEDLARKYASELHATEIMLLAYYVAAVNIETTYKALKDEHAKLDAAEAGEVETGGENAVAEYEPFEGIALADTFQITEEDDQLDYDVFAQNNERIQRQLDAPINVVIGNPPYSVGQTSANDLNANMKYPTLDKRIEDTYAARSTATNKNSLYDSYIRAFRWATDRIGDQGIVAFVTNNGWIDGNTADGIRLSMAEDFTDLYVLNLRGNSRTAGELAKKEGGNVFDIRVGIQVLLAVKNPKQRQHHIHYRGAEDYLTKNEKVELVKRSRPQNLSWREITPNNYGDWLSQRSDTFSTWPVIGEKKGSSTKVFHIYSAGLQTNRDAWVYNFNRETLVSKVRDSINQFNSMESSKRLDSTKIKWTSTFDQQLKSKHVQRWNSESIRTGLYRPFERQLLYFDSDLNHRQGKLPTMFPTPEHYNIGFYVVNPGSAKPFATFATDLIPDLALYGSNAGQFFPRWTWEQVHENDGVLALSFDNSTEVIHGYRRIANITDEILEIYQSSLGNDVSKDDIFNYVYGQLHDPNYRTTYAADLKKMLPHIETPTDRDRFDLVTQAGQHLMDLHVNYELVEPWPLDIQLTKTADPSDRETWRVQKMKWAKRQYPDTGKKVNDVTTIIYNSKVTIAGIPEEADDYLLGSRSALAWIIDRYQVKKDKASGIVNDPNDWADEVGNPSFIVDLIGKVTRVAVETQGILSEFDQTP